MHLTSQKKKKQNTWEGGGGKKFLFEVVSTKDPDYRLRPEFISFLDMT